MKQKFMITSLLLSLLLFGGCNTKSHSNTTTASAHSSVKTPVHSQTKAVKNKKKLNAQTALSTANVKRRVVAWFISQPNFKIAEPSKVVFLDAATPTWQKVRGKTILGGQIITAQNEHWAVEIQTNGQCKVFDPMNLNEPPQTFNLFDITQEQLTHVRKDVTKLNPAKPNQPNAQGLKTGEINDRLTSYFVQTYGLDPASLTIAMKAKKGWLDVNGTDLYCATITSPAGAWMIEMTNDGAAYLQVGNASQIPGMIYHQQQGNPTFNLFDFKPMAPTISDNSITA